MVANENGFNQPSWSVVQTHQPVSEPIVAGMALGWLAAVLGFYILAIFIIFKCVKNRKNERSDSDSQQPSQKQDKEEGEKKKSDSKNESSEEKKHSIIVQKGLRRKHVYEDNPTLELVLEPERSTEMRRMGESFKDKH